MVAHRDEEVLLVQHLVVLEVVQQGIGHCPRLSRQKMAVPSTRVGGLMKTDPENP